MATKESHLQMGLVAIFVPFLLSMAIVQARRHQEYWHWYVCKRSDVIVDGRKPLLAGYDNTTRHMHKPCAGLLVVTDGVSPMPMAYLLFF